MGDEVLFTADPGIPFEVYLPPDPTLTSPALIGVTSFFTFMILYSTLVPISLYISVEMIRYVGKPYSWNPLDIAIAQMNIVGPVKGQKRLFFSDFHVIYLN